MPEPVNNFSPVKTPKITRRRKPIIKLVSEPNTVQPKKMLSLETGEKRKKSLTTIDSPDEPVKKRVQLCKQNFEQFESSTFVANENKMTVNADVDVYDDEESMNMQLTVESFIISDIQDFRENYDFRDQPIQSLVVNNIETPTPSPTKSINSDHVEESHRPKTVAETVLMLNEFDAKQKKKSILYDAQLRGFAQRDKEYYEKKRSLRKRDKAAAEACRARNFKSGRNCSTMGDMSSCSTSENDTSARFSNHGSGSEICLGSEHEASTRVVHAAEEVIPDSEAQNVTLGNVKEKKQVEEVGCSTSENDTSARLSNHGSGSEICLGSEHEASTRVVHAAEEVIPDSEAQNVTLGIVKEKKQVEEVSCVSCETLRSNNVSLCQKLMKLESKCEKAKDLIAQLSKELD